MVSKHGQRQKCSCSVLELCCFEYSLGNYLSVEGGALHVIKGISSDLWTEVLIEKTYDIHIGQDVNVFYKS